MRFRDFEICCELSVTKSVNCTSALHSWFGGVISSGALRPEKKVVLAKDPTIFIEFRIFLDDMVEFEWNLGF